MNAHISQSDSADASSADKAATSQAPASGVAARIRSKGDFLTASEIQTLRLSFEWGESACHAARKVSCSNRVAQKYFAQFKGNPNSQRKSRARAPEDKIAAPKPAKPALPSRFYKGNFEL